MMSKKMEFFITLLASFYFGLIFPIFVGLILMGGIDWPHVPINCLLGTVVGTVMGTIIPMGRISAGLAMKIVKNPGSFLFTCVRYIFMVAMLLLILMPIFITFDACALGDAPVMAVLPHCYDMYPQVFLIAYIAALIEDKPIAWLAAILAGENKN